MLSDKPQPIGLKELIERVKQELLEAHDPDNLLFAIGQVELEISFTVERTMDGGVNFQVVQTGVEKTMADLQTIKVMLEPLVTPEQLRENLPESKKAVAGQTLMRGRE